jgi:septum formation protein
MLARRAAAKERAVPKLSLATPLVLGSASPRRRELLGLLRLPFVVLVPTVDETERAGESPGEYLERVVALKLDAVARHAELRATRGAAVVVADTSVVLDGVVLGKPHDAIEASNMLQRLVGRAHEVTTRFCVARLVDGRLAEVRARSVTSSVRFRAATPGELERYAASGEGLDKAGGYAIQGLGSFLVERLEGSFPAVMGLPTAELIVELAALGVLGDYP